MHVDLTGTTGADRSDEQRLILQGIQQGMSCVSEGRKCKCRVMRRPLGTAGTKRTWWPCVCWLGSGVLREEHIRELPQPGLLLQACSRHTARLCL